MKATLSYRSFWAGSVLMLLFLSCKSAKIAATEGLDAHASAKSVIKAHYKAPLDFRTMAGKLKIDYSDGDTEQSVTVSLRMQKDSAIWLSAPLGMVKALITPHRASFYNKLDNAYFDGDFSYLSDILGTDIDFEKLQNLLLGQAFFDLRENRYDLTLTDQAYRLTPKDPLGPLKALFQIEPEHFRIAGLQLAQPLEDRLLQVQYAHYQKIGTYIVPGEIEIRASEGAHQNLIGIAYKGVAFDQPMSFPFKIPEGYHEIELGK